MTARAARRRTCRKRANRRSGPISPWRVVGTKVGGKSAGLMIVDGAGDRFILKFDEVGAPEMETAANVVAQRLLWAAGFNVPEDDVVFFALAFFDFDGFDLASLDLREKLAVRKRRILGLGLAQHRDEHQDHHQDDEP